MKDTFTLVQEQKWGKNSQVNLSTLCGVGGDHIKKMEREDVLIEERSILLWWGKVVELDRTSGWVSTAV